MNESKKPSRFDRVSRERLSRVKAMLDDGASNNEICKTLKMNHATITRHFPGAGWTPRQAGQAARMSRILRAL